MERENRTAFFGERGRIPGMSVEILGIGIATPRQSLQQDKIAALAKAYSCENSKQERVLESLYRMTEIKQRGSVLVGGNDDEQSMPFFPTRISSDDHGPGTEERMQRYAQESVPLAVAAAENALRESGLLLSEITHLVTVSCTGFFAPGPDIALIKRLNLNPEVSRLHIGFMGCHGALNGLRQCLSVAGADPDARILLCAVELCSLHMQYGWNPHSILANALFADGAAAVVLAPAKDNRDESKAWKVVSSGSCVLPDCEDAMTWKIGDHGFEMTLSHRIPDLIRQHLRPWLERWLARHSQTIGNIPTWAVHPGGPRILREVVDVLYLPNDSIAASRAVLAEFGNMSSPTILFILDRLRAQGAPRPCLAIGFGPGLAIEVALLM